MATVSKQQGSPHLQQNESSVGSSVLRTDDGWLLSTPLTLTAHCALRTAPRAPHPAHCTLHPAHCTPHTSHHFCCER